MFGSKFLLLLLLLSSLAMSAPKKSRRPPRPLRKPAMSRFFLATSLGNWQHGAMVTDGTDSFSFSGTSLAMGLGIGYTASLGMFSLVTQGQALLGSSDLGFLTGIIPGVDASLSGRGLGFFGAKVDVSFLSHFGEGVAWGLGVPLMTTFYFKRNLGDGVTLKTQDFIQWGAFIDFRLKRGWAVFNPKVGFIKNLRQYFVSMDCQWHF